MGLSRLVAKCRACPYVSTCEHKQMEALGYLPMSEPTVEIRTDRSVQIDNLLTALNCCYTNMQAGVSKSQNNIREVMTHDHGRDSGGCSKDQGCLGGIWPVDGGGCTGT